MTIVGTLAKICARDAPLLSFDGMAARNVRSVQRRGIHTGSRRPKRAIQDAASTISR